jgi:outer membrane lipoprotein SlyB
MIRILIALVVLSVLSGCASPDFGSPDVYQRSDVQRAGTLEQATVVRVRRITIQVPGNNSGITGLVSAGLGAFLGSKTIGNGSGRYVAAAMSGAVTGFVAQHVSDALSRTAGLEIIVRKADGSLRVISQPDDQLFSPGDRVLLMDTSSGVRVTH